MTDFFRNCRAPKNHFKCAVAVVNRTAHRCTWLPIGAAKPSVRCCWTVGPHCRLKINSYGCPLCHFWSCSMGLHVCPIGFLYNDHATDSSACCVHVQSYETGIAGSRLCSTLAGQHSVEPYSCQNWFRSILSGSKRSFSWPIGCATRLACVCRVADDVPLMSPRISFPTLCSFMRDCRPAKVICYVHSRVSPWQHPCRSPSLPLPAAEHGAPTLCSHGRPRKRLCVAAGPWGLTGRS